MNKPDDNDCKIPINKKYNWIKLLPSSYFSGAFLDLSNKKYSFELMNLLILKLILSRKLMYIAAYIQSGLLMKSSRSNQEDNNLIWLYLLKSERNFKAYFEFAKYIACSKFKVISLFVVVRTFDKTLT